MKRYFVPLVPLLCFVVSCGIDKKNKQSKKNIEMPADVLKNPELSLKATAPRDILYVSKNIANNQQSNLFLAEKDGGLGADLDQDNKLIPYSGIPVQIEAKDLLGKPKVSVVAAAATAARNDEKCSQLFSYNENLKLIQVHTDKITGLSICNVTVSAASEEDKVYADSASFEIAVNLPFSEYMKKSDNSAKYIQKYLGVSDRNLDKSIDITAKHLKDKNNKQSLVLDFDDNKVTKEDQLEFLDAITGAQSIKSLSLAKTNLINLNAVAKLENLESLDISDTKVSESDFKLLSKLSKLKKLAVRDLDIKDFSNIVRYFPQLEELDISNNKRIVNISTLKDMKNLRILKVANIGLTSIAPLEHLTELTFLDIANNDLSNIQSSSYSILSNLYNLMHLNTSFTKIPDTLLNEYFNTASAQKLKTFINRNHFKRFQVGNCQYNNFEKITNLQKLVNLEYLDISGNSCQTEKGKFQGLLTTKPLQKMSQLKTLNIANNIISDLNHIKNLEIPKIVLNELDKQNNVYQRETGIYATREDCRSILGAHERACSTLSVDLPDEIVKNPSLSLQATIPDDILYVAANNTLSKHANKNSAFSKLIPYSGIPITLNSKDLTAKPKISVVAAAVTSAKNDEKCPQLFTYNESLKLVQIHTDKITGLSICNVTVSAASEADKVSASPTTFEVALNLTFSEYAKKKDRAAKYIQKYLGFSDSVINNYDNFLENYLKENNQNLVLDFDANKVTKEDQLEFLDAITGAQSIKSLSLAKTNLSNLNAIARLENLEYLDISNTKVSEADLKLLSKIPKLKKLAVRDLDIKDFSNITQYLANLEELDIGNNKRIASLNTLKDMKNLRALKISNTNLNTLDPLQTLSQLVYLDISHNDLSNISSGSYAMLSNLSNLMHLNTSFTKIPDTLLNEYFNTASAQKIKTFINRNHFKRFQVGNCQYNNFEKITNLQKLVNLEYLDISGNSCQTEKGKFQGLLTTKPLQKMSQLKTLNIANNIISDLNGIKNLEIPKIILNELDTQNNAYQRETGIYATREACRSILGAHERACSTLSVDLPDEIVKNPTLSLQPLVPQETLYASSGAVGKPEANRRSKRAIRHGSERIIYNHEGSLFRAEKDGGLGADLDQDNKLIPYNGIPIVIEAKDLTGKPKVSVVAAAATAARNDEKCPELFTYNENLNLIQIHTDRITGLSICKVTVSASSETDKVYSETVSFEVALNLTFSEYVKKSDPSTKYIKKYIGNEENDLNRVAYYLARYLKDKQNSQNLVLDFDETKFKKEDQFEFFDSITGAQSIKSLSVAKINLVNVNAIIKLENLEALDISGTKISENDLKLLSRLSKLKKLAVRDLDIKDLANITRFLPNLEELDISENKRVVNISTLKDMENLRVLKVSNIGLTSLEPIELLTQLNSLDLSKNDLSNMDKSQYTILANLYNLAHLNTSFTKISDEFLNNYFDVTSAQRLLTFINRNHFNRSQVGNCQYNNFEEISNLRKLVNLEYLDISGNSCQIQKGVFKGLLTTTPFKYMYNLKTLNIANNIISDLNGIKLLDLGKLILNELNTKDSVYLKETALSVTREACVNILGLYQRACSTLSSGKFVTIKFAAGHNEWSVPLNVFKVRLLGASGANGGAGGGGSGTSHSSYRGSWSDFTQGGNGGNSGKANGELINLGERGKQCHLAMPVQVREPAGTNGADADLGSLTYFKNVSFTRAAEYIKEGFYPRNRIRIGGKGGIGGEARKGEWPERCADAATGGAGGNGINGWNSLVEIYEADVIPGEKIGFVVGTGGKGGNGGTGSKALHRGTHNFRFANDGLDGAAGKDGEHGFLEITYEIYQ